MTATDTDTLNAQATLAITKTDNDGGSSVTPTVGAAVPGTSITYTIVASNTGPSTATGASVTDPLASNPAISSDTWTATGSGGATGFSASGSGSIDDSLTIPSGGSVTYTVVATITSSATGTLSNTATRLGLRRLHGDGHRHRHASTPRPPCPSPRPTAVSSVVAGTSDTYTIVVSEHRAVRRLQPERGRHPARPRASPTSRARTCRPGSPSRPATDTWTLASLASGQSVTLELAGTVPSGATGSTYVEHGHRLGLRRLHGERPPTPTP